MVLPIIVGAVGIGTSALGIAKGNEGCSNIQEAKRRGRRALYQYQLAVESLQETCEAVNHIAELYGELQIHARDSVIQRFIEFIKRTGRRASLSEWLLLEGIESSIHKFHPFQPNILTIEDLTDGVYSAVNSGYAAGSTVVGMAGAFGKVTVPRFLGLFTKQVAVSELGLSGAVTYLGGGSTLLGSAVLGVGTLGPAMAVGGFKLAEKGEKALTQAAKYELDVNTAIAELERGEVYFQYIGQRIREGEILVRKLQQSALQHIEELEATPPPVRKGFWAFPLVAFFVNAFIGVFVRIPILNYLFRDTYLFKFQQTAILVKALAEILKVPIVNNDGQLNSKFVKITAKYRTLGEN